MTIVANRSNQDQVQNQFGVLVSESEYDSEDSEASESASVTLSRHREYIREVQADQDQLLSAAQLRANDEDDDWEVDTMALHVVTIADLESYCTATVRAIHDYTTSEVQEWKRRIVAILSQFPCKLHDHGHAYLLEDRESFRKRSGIEDAEVPSSPTRPVQSQAPGAFREYYFLLEIYENHSNINRAAVGLLRKLFPSGLVGLEVGFDMLPSNLTVQKAYDHLISMAKEPTIDTEAAIKLQVEAYKKTYTPGPMGPTVFFQELEHNQFQLTQTNADDTGTRLVLTNNVIRTISIAAFRKAGHLLQNIEFAEAEWKKADTEYDNSHLVPEIIATKYSRFKKHWIKHLSRIYKGGDKGGTTRSANSATDLDKRFAAFEAAQQALQENQCQLGDAMNVFVQNSDASTLEGGGIPPVIDTKSTGGETDYSAMIAHNRELVAAIADLKANTTVPATAGTGGKKVIMHWRQWTDYCYGCGVNLQHISKFCPRKKDGHKDDATFSDKKGGLATRDHLWQHWCEPITNRLHKVLPPNAKTTA